MEPPSALASRPETTRRPVRRRTLAGSRRIADLARLRAALDELEALAASMARDGERLLDAPHVAPNFVRDALHLHARITSIQAAAASTRPFLARLEAHAGRREAP